MRSSILAFAPVASLCLAPFGRAEELATRTIDAFGAGLVGYQDERGSSSVLHEEVLGSERDLLVEEGRLTIRWDGIDSDPFSLDGTGLGGLDLSEGGRFDRVLVERASGSEALGVTLVVWTSEQRASRVLARGTERIELRFDQLEAVLGDGCDLRDVGALELVLEGAATPAAPLSVALAGPRARLATLPPTTSRGGDASLAVVGGPIPATLILAQGQAPAGAPLGETVSTLNSPFTNGLGQVGFVAALTPSNARLVYLEDGTIFVSSDVLSNTLTGGEGTMGVSDTGGFIYSPSIDGTDGVWTHNGLLAVGATQAAGFPVGTNSTFHSRPQMQPGGAATWVSGFNESGGTSSQGRMLYRSSDATSGNTVVVLRSDDLVAGPNLPIDRPSGVGFSYHFSDDGAHHIQVLLLDTGSTVNDDVVWVDGVVIARETEPTGQGDNWDNFDDVSINSQGNFLFSGDTDGATTSDEFIAFNGVIAIREGDVIGGVTLTSGASVNAVSINDLDEAAFLWSISGGTEILFFSSDATDLGGSAVELLRTGDQVDTTGDNVADATVTDFNASPVIGPGLSLGEDGRVIVEVDLDFGAGSVEAILALRTPSAVTRFCDGNDGALATCPCANAGDPDSGCDNSSGSGGVRIEVAKLDRLGSQATISAAGFPPAGQPTVVLMRANDALGAPIVFGDGVRCVGNTGLGRIQATTAIGGSAVHAFTHGAGAGDFYYQSWYRNTPPFCTPERFNLSNGVKIAW